MEHFSFSRDLLRFFLFRGNRAQEMRGRLTRLYGRSDIYSRTYSKYYHIERTPSSPGNPIFLIFSSNSRMPLSVSALIFNLTKLRRRPSYSSLTQSLSIFSRLRKIRCKMLLNTVQSIFPLERIFFFLKL